MSEGTVRVQATVERLANPPVPRWPVKVTIELSQRNRRGSRLTAKIGRQWLEGVIATSRPPGLVGFLARMPSNGDDIILVDGLLQLPTGIRYGAPPSAQAEVDPEEGLYMPPTQADRDGVRALSEDDDEGAWDGSVSEALQAQQACSVNGANVACGSCTAVEQRISGIATNLVHVPAAHVIAGAANDQLNDLASQALVAMRTAAIADGAVAAGSDFLKLVSGFRDYPSQARIWRNKMRQVFTTFGCTNWAAIDPVVVATSQALSTVAPPHARNAWLDRFRQELRTAGVAPQGCVDAQIRAAARAEHVTVPASGPIDIPGVAVAIGRKTVATPGSSPHHTGRAVDLHMGHAPGSTGVSSSSTNVTWQRQQRWYQWLVCNAARFGYHPYNREPWHWEHTPPPSTAPVPGTPTSSALDDETTQIRAALGQLGLSATQVDAFAAGQGIAALLPICRALGPVVLLELLRRLHYPVAYILNPPHSYDSDAQANRTLGTTNFTRLAPRLLLTIPGYFREQARQSRDAVEAFILESMGWLIMGSIADRVRNAINVDFWLPHGPYWATAVPNPIPAQAASIQQLILRMSLIDTNLTTAEFNGRAAAWRNGAAGRQWFFETGQGAQPAAQAFYTDAITGAAPAIAIPAVANISTQRGQVQAAWTARVAAADANPATPPLSAASTLALVRCQNIPVAGIVGGVDLTRITSLEIVSTWPVLRPAARPKRSLSVLAATRPAWEGVMRSIMELGWNDLLFQTAGTGCFRGTKTPGTVAGQNPNSARNMSNHSLAIAGDFNDFENKQPRAGSPATAAGTMDPRLIALFRAFNFRWGGNYTAPSTPDPMHFEYI
ncbi:MAG: hypothetical protein HOW73_23950 [Polyangiaceae bacterium]|nr:hypothetical protein [Polyangiaceae bacterium]